MDVNMRTRTQNGMSNQIHPLHGGVLVTFAIGNGQRVGAFHDHFEIILHIRTIMQSLMDGQQVCLLPNIFFPQEM